MTKALRVHFVRTWNLDYVKLHVYNAMVETKEGGKSETDEVIARTLMFLVNIRIIISHPSGGVTGSEDINIGSLPGKAE